MMTKPRRDTPSPSRESVDPTSAADGNCPVGLRRYRTEWSEELAQFALPVDDDYAQHLVADVLAMNHPTGP